jgi:hypothetical protein
VVESVNRSSYRVTVETNGTPELLPRPLRIRPAYADGRTRFVRTADGVETTPVGAAPSYALRSAGLVRTYLSVADQQLSGTARRNGTVYHLLQADADTDPDRSLDWREPSTSALITDEGLVYGLYRQHVDVGVEPTVTVVLEWEYGRRDADSGLRPPDWVRGADGTRAEVETGNETGNQTGRGTAGDDDA